MRFSVTYELISESSASHGDACESGFLAESCTLREAVEELTSGEGGFYADHIEADTCPLSLETPPRWLTGYPAPDYAWMGDRGAGPDGSQIISEVRSLHLPESITPSSAIRIARLLGCYGVES